MKLHSYTSECRLWFVLLFLAASGNWYVVVGQIAIELLWAHVPLCLDASDLSLQNARGFCRRPIELRSTHVELVKFNSPLR